MKRLLLVLLAPFCTLAVLGPVAVVLQPFSGGGAQPGSGEPFLVFEQNIGQAPGHVEYIARAPGQTLLLGRDGATLLLEEFGEPLNLDGLAPGQPLLLPEPRTKVVEMRFEGANPAAALSGERRTDVAVNYYLGDDPSGWLEGVPAFERVRIDDLYPGIDLVFYGKAGSLEYDLIVAPGADPGLVRLRFDGAEAMTLDSGGDLVLETGQHDLRVRAPVVYQATPDGRRPVDGRYVLDGQGVSFALGGYDRTMALVIDPVLEYGTYIGGTSFDQAAYLAAGEDGRVWVVGHSRSLDLDGEAPAGDEELDYYDLFIMILILIALDEEGQGRYGGTAFEVEAVTHFGGTNHELASQVVPLGDTAWISGFTFSDDLPTTGDPYQDSFGGVIDAILVRVGADGVVDYSTYYGGESTEQAFDMIYDGGSLWQVGTTFSGDDFPDAGPFQTKGFGDFDGYIAQWSLEGELVRASRFGTPGSDSATSIARVGDHVIVSAQTDGPMEVSKGAYQTEPGGGLDAWLGRFAGFDTGFDAATFYGGDGHDTPIRVRPYGTSDVFWAVGSTRSTNLPTTPGSHQPDYSGGELRDGFVASFGTDLSQLQYGSYDGAADLDEVYRDATNIGYGGWTGWGALVSIEEGAGAGGWLVPWHVNGDQPAGAPYLVRGAPVAISGEKGSVTTPLGVAASAGWLFMGGETNAQELPVTAGGYQPELRGPSDGVFFAWTTAVDLEMSVGPIEPAAEGGSLSARVYATVRNGGPAEAPLSRVDFGTTLPGTQIDVTSGVVAEVEGKSIWRLGTLAPGQEAFAQVRVPLDPAAVGKHKVLDLSARQAAFDRAPVNNTNQAGWYSWYLYEGYNQVAWKGPAVAAGGGRAHASSVIGSLDASVEPDAWRSVSYYDQASSTWLQTFSDAPIDSFNTLDELVPDEEYWVFVVEPAAMVVAGP